MPMPIEDLTGHRFGRLLVISAPRRDTRPGSKTETVSMVKCDCGNTKEVPNRALKNGTTSCGCKTRTHGMTRSPTHSSWSNMISRCYNTNNPRYKDWGGRGIKVCDRWRHSFLNFLEDMGERPKGMTLDRYPDPNGNYEPGNCRWATPKQQAENKRGQESRKSTSIKNTEGSSE